MKFSGVLQLFTFYVQSLVATPPPASHSLTHTQVSLHPGMYGFLTTLKVSEPTATHTIHHFKTHTSHHTVHTPHPHYSYPSSIRDQITAGDLLGRQPSSLRLYGSYMPGTSEGPHGCMHPATFTHPAPGSEVTFKPVVHSTQTEHEKPTHPIHHTQTGGSRLMPGEKIVKQLTSFKDCAFGTLHGVPSCVLPNDSILRTPPPGSAATFLTTLPTLIVTTPVPSVTSPPSTIPKLTLTAPFPLQTPSGWFSSSSTSTSTLIASGSPYSVTLILVSTNPSSLSSPPATTLHTLAATTPVVSGTLNGTLTLTPSPQSTTKTSGAAAAYTNPKRHKVIGVGAESTIPVLVLVACLLACVVQAGAGL